MDYINIHGVLIPQIGVGTYSQQGNTLQDVVRTAVDCGITLFDTAYKYNNEAELANAISQTNIVKPIIQSKVCARQLLGSWSMLRMNRQSVMQAYNMSCKKMQTDKIDIFLLHSYFNGCEKYYQQLIELRERGACLIVGVCNANINQLKQIYNYTGEYPMILQTEIHVYNNQKKLIDFCHDNNIVVEARSPFAHGDVIHEWQNLPQLKTIACKYNKTIPQVILRWLVQQKLIVIYRSANRLHIGENADIFDFDLQAHEMCVIDQLNQDKSFGFISNKRV